MKPHRSLLAVISLAGATLLAGLLHLTAAEQPQHLLVWKFDDLRLGSKGKPATGISQSVRDVAEWADQHQVPISFGIICNTLANPNPEDVAWVKSHAVEHGGRIEFWHHGWDHRKAVPATGGNETCEFQQQDLAYQTCHLRDGIDAMRHATGLVFTTFGAPWNAVDATTVTAMDACPELNVWFYGPKTDQHRAVLPRTINLEYATGKVSYDLFAAQYAKASGIPCLVLQGHPPLWGDNDLADFKRIAELLQRDGWQTVTPRDAATRLKP